MTVPRKRQREVEVALTLTFNVCKTGYRSKASDFASTSALQLAL